MAEGSVSQVCKLGNAMVRWSWQNCVSNTTKKYYQNTGGEQKFRRKKGIFHNWMVHDHETHHAKSMESETHLLSERKSLESTLDSADNMRTNLEKTATESTVKAKTKIKKPDKVSNLVG